MIYDILWTVMVEFGNFTQRVRNSYEGRHYRAGASDLFLAITGDVFLTEQGYVEGSLQEVEGDLVTAAYTVWGWDPNTGDASKKNPAQILVSTTDIQGDIDNRFYSIDKFGLRKQMVGWETEDQPLDSRDIGYLSRIKDGIVQELVAGLGGVKLQELASDFALTLDLLGEVRESELSGPAAVSRTRHVPRLLGGYEYILSTAQTQTEDQFILVLKSVAPVSEDLLSAGYVDEIQYHFMKMPYQLPEKPLYKVISCHNVGISKACHPLQLRKVDIPILSDVMMDLYFQVAVMLFESRYDSRFAGEWVRQLVSREI